MRFRHQYYKESLELGISPVVDRSSPRSRDGKARKDAKNGAERGLTSRYPRLQAKQNAAGFGIVGCGPLNPTGKELIQLWKNLPELLRIVRAGRMDRLDAAPNAALDPQPI
jgi:hypothetical protein